MKTIHTPKCIEFDRKLKEVHDAWVAKWPNYCKNCNGWGGFHSTYDPSPAGVSLSPGVMEDFDPCVACLEQLICARCSAKNPQWEDQLGEKFVCLQCGWDSEDPDAAPPDCRDWPCPCELEEEKRQQDEYYKEMQKDYQELVKSGRTP